MASPTPDPYPTPAVRRQANAANVQRAIKRIQSGQAYTKASVKRLASAGVNVGSLLRDTPGRGLPGAQAGQLQQQQAAAQQRATQMRPASRGTYKGDVKNVTVDLKALKRQIGRPKRPAAVKGYSRNV